MIKAPSLVILTAVTATGPLALNIFIPSMPGLQDAFATDYATIQLTLTLYLVSTAIAQLFIGSFSDRFGRRPVMLLGLSLFLLGSVAASLATSIEMLIGSRIIQAIGGCAGIVLSRTMIRDVYEQDLAASKIAYVTMAMVIAPMIAPSLGGFLDVWFSWRASFIAVAVMGAVVLACSVVMLHETHHQKQPMAGLLGLLRSFARLLRLPKFCGYALTAAFSSGMFFAFLAGAPYIMVEIMGRAPSEYGLYFILVSLGYMLGNYIASQWSQRIGTQRMILIALALAFIGVGSLVFIGMAGVLVPLAFFGPMVVIAISNGLSLPNSMAAAIGIRPKAIGTASGLTGFLQISIGALATWVVGWLQDDSQWPMIWVMFAFAWLALGSFLLAWRSQRPILFST